MSLNGAETKAGSPAPAAAPAPVVNLMDTLPERMSCDVVIVGWGPAAMATSILLGQRGIKVIAVERWPARWNLPRAGHFDGESFRTFQRMGIVEDMELIARPMLQWNLVTAEKDLLANIKMGEAGNGWKESYITYQPLFEAIFETRGRELGAQVYMGVTAAEIRQTEDAAELVVHRTDNPSMRCTIEASFIIGADGAGSFTRRAMGSERQDLGFKVNAQLVIDFEHNDPDVDLPQLPGVFQVLDINRPELAGRWSGGRWSRWEFHALENESREYLESEATCWKLLSKWGIFPGDGKIVRHSVYNFESSIASKWREGRVLLAGDAAHTMPPFMGQGLCSGIRDGMNLAWKLEAILAGHANLSLLDTYPSERVPHVREFISMSMNVGNMVLMTDPDQAVKRDAILRSGQLPPAPPFPRLGNGIVRAPDAPNGHPTDGKPSVQARVALGRKIERLDEFLGNSWRVISRHPVPDSLFSDAQIRLLHDLRIDVAHISPASNAQYVDVDGEYDLWYRNTGRKAFLVRPDFYVFGSVATVSELPGLLDDLASALAEHGWEGLSGHAAPGLESLQLVRP